MKILASSLDNLVQLANSHSIEQPYVTFTVGSPTNVKIIIKDKNNDDGYYKEIVGSSSASTSSDSFNTSGVVTLNLMECLKMNSIFFNFTMVDASTIKCNIDTSISYQIAVEGTGLTIGGTYSTYEALSPNKMVMMLQGNIDSNTTNITMEKYNNNPTISFNVTSPFKYSTSNKPISVNITAYQMYDSKASLVTVPYPSAIIMPTTLTKFQSVNYDEYHYTGGTKVNFLTNNLNRYYNYDEWVGLSILSDVDVVGLKKSYYTNSGVFLDTRYVSNKVEKNGIRYDIYDTFDLLEIEAIYNKQVGYILVYGWDGSKEITNPIRYDIIPKCKGNNEIFFLNEIGGIDSFNFTNTKTIDRKIDDQSTFFVNQIRPYDDVYEMEYTKQKRNEITYTLTTHQINRETAEWLNELNKSKYIYLFNGLERPTYTIIIVDKFDIKTNSSDKEFELELEYHISDNENNV